jgi:DHA1 family tetracycline resistance protein-like MFS transporter
VLGRIVAGMFGATFTPAGAYIADVSPPEKRAANFGLIGVAFGLGFIVGPALGGLLGATNLRLPFVVCAGLTFVNLLFGLLVMPESLKPENRRAVDWSQTNPLGALNAIWRFPSVALLIPVYVAVQLAQQGLQSVWVPYTTFRYTGASATSACRWRSSVCSLQSRRVRWWGRSWPASASSERWSARSSSRS